VINGMSHIEMCLPYNRNIAERLSNEIFANSPNCILLIDNQCKLIEMNQTAEEKFGCTSESLKDQEVDSFLPAEIFKEALKTHKSFPKEKVNLERYGLIMYRDVIYLEKQDALLVIFADITPEEKRKQEMSKLKRSTIDVTQTIIDKQMRVAQEIASLLGETTAETKVAIMKLRDVLREEGEY
jgi:PAS domain S-box-containing protein